MKKKLLYLILGGLFIFTPSVFAEKYTLNKIDSGATNTVRYEIVITEVGGGVDKTGKLTCDIGSVDDVSCEIKALTGFTITDGVVVSGDTGITEGDKVAYVDVINGSSSYKTVTLVLKSNGSNVAEKSQISVGPYKSQAPKSGNAALSSLAISQGKMVPDFKPETTNYTIYGIQDTIQSIRFTPQCAEGDCGFNLASDQRISGMSVDLKDGENEISLKVTSEDGKNTVTYTFKVYKGETSFNSAKLKSINTDRFVLTPAFDKNVKDYTLVVPDSIKTLSNIIKWEAEDASANVSVEGLDNLTGTETTVKIIVENASGDEKTTYTIVVSFEKEEEITIKKYKDGNITFETSDGEVKVLSEEEFKEKYPEEWEKIEKGTYKFDKDGNIITKTVTKKEQKKKSKVWLIVLLIVIGLIIIGVSAYFIFFRKKKSKKKDGEKEENGESDIENEDTIDKVDSDPDYQIEKEIEASKKDVDETMDIDSALEDLMNTKQYDFKDED